MTESSRTSFTPLPSTGPATPRIGQHPSSTRSESVTPAVRPDVDEPAGLAEWLASPAARELVGQWVLLTRDYEVIDYAPAPSELFERHPEIRSPFIVFVRPSNIRYAG
jgi:hypothetical protein